MMDEKGKVRSCGKNGGVNVRDTGGKFWDCVDVFNLIAGKPNEYYGDRAGHRGGEDYSLHSSIIFFDFPSQDVQVPRSRSRIQIFSLPENIFVHTIGLS